MSALPAKSLTRRALEAAGAVEGELAGGPGWVAEDDPPSPEPEHGVAMLPALDPTTMGWKQRAWYLPEAAGEAFDSVGNGGPTLWVDGRSVVAWAQTTDGVIHTHYFERVAPARRREIDERVAEVAREAAAGKLYTAKETGVLSKSVQAGSVSSAKTYARNARSLTVGEAFAMALLRP